MSDIFRSRHGSRARLDFDAEELRGVAYSLGLHDAGAQEMLELADELDRRDGKLDDTKDEGRG